MSDECEKCGQRGLNCQCEFHKFMMNINDQYYCFNPESVEIEPINFGTRSDEIANLKEI